VIVLRSLVFATALLASGGSFAQSPSPGSSGLGAPYVLQPPTASVLGGVLAASAPANQFMTGIGLTGAPTFAQPSFANLSGTIATGQISGAYSGITGVGTLASGAVPWSLLTSTPTTLAGYGITNGATNGANSNITSLTGLTTPLTVAQGGTARATASQTALNNITGNTYPSSGTNGDVATMAASGAYQDSGVLLSSLAPLVSPSFTTPTLGAATGISLGVTNSLAATALTLGVGGGPATCASLVGLECIHFATNRNLLVTYQNGYMQFSGLNDASSAFAPIYWDASPLNLNTLSNGAVAFGTGTITMPDAGTYGLSGINGSNVGATTPGTGKFSTLAATSHITATSTAPTISACGTGSPSISGSDNFGTVVAGTVATSCVINFGTTWGAAPSCNVSSGTAIASLTVASSTTQLTIGGTALGGDTIKWVCGSTASLRMPRFAANDNTYDG
jgi:hypothetical protein